MSYREFKAMFLPQGILKERRTPRRGRKRLRKSRKNKTKSARLTVKEYSNGTLLKCPKILIKRVIYQCSLLKFLNSIFTKFFFSV